MRIVGEVWRRLLSISRSKHFVSGRKDIIAERVTICIYCSISVQQMLAMQGIHSICSDRGDAGGAGCTGGALRSTGHVSPASLAAEY